MKFEWDEDKRRINLERHGLDFEDAEELFTDDAFFIEDKRKDYGEIRYILYGYLYSRLVIVVFTKRDENIRIISMRKANKREQNADKKRLTENRPDVG